MGYATVKSSSYGVEITGNRVLKFQRQKRKFSISNGNILSEARIKISIWKQSRVMKSLTMGHEINLTNGKRVQTIIGGGYQNLIRIAI